jgi:hypothetical protein
VFPYYLRANEIISESFNFSSDKFFEGFADVPVFQGISTPDLCIKDLTKNEEWAEPTLRIDTLRCPYGSISCRGIKIQVRP